MHSFINSHGVYILIQQQGVFISYCLSNENQIELYYNSVEEALSNIGKSSLENIASEDLL
jgi:hypothetical protein